jgi:ABC-type glycerol-3-phosphate transport system substrate-binding protein
MSFTLLAGCGGGEENLFEIPDFVFVPEFIELKGDFEYLRSFAYAGDKIVFAADAIIDADTFTYGTKLFSMNIDGSNMSELANYVPPSPMPGVEGNFSINAISVDNEGNIWVMEEGWFYTFNLPDDFDGDENDKWYYYEHLGGISSIRKLDSTGAEILTLSLTDLNLITSPDDYFQVLAFVVDGDGNIYLSAATNEGNSVYVITPGSNRPIKIEVEGWSWVNRFIIMPDGQVAFAGDSTNEEGFYVRVLQTIDVAAGKIGESVELPRNAWDVYAGGGDYDIIFNQNNALYGREIETGEVVLLVNWLNTDIPQGNMDNITMLPDGRIMLTNQSWSVSGSSFDLVLLTRTAYSELPERIVLTLATLWSSQELRASVSEFNRTNQEYRIHVVDFSAFNTEDDWNAGLTRLSTEIIAGRVPDILDLSSLPARQYANRGFLESLYEYIDNDPEINRSDLMEGALRAAEINGNLYQLFSGFTISTLIGHPSVVGSNPGWNMQEFQAVLDANPQADFPLGQWLTKWSFLESTIMFSLDEYVDWTRGTTNFDSQNFIQLLEFANTFPDEFDWGRNWDIGWPDDGWMDEDQLIAMGRQIMVRLSWFSDFWTYRQYLAYFGGEIVFKGFPTEDRNGSSIMIPNSFAMSAESKHKDGVWEFMRTLLFADWQRENAMWFLPTNRTYFNERLEEAMREDPNFGVHRSVVVIGDGPDMAWSPPEMKPLTQADADRLFALIDSITFTASWNIDEGLMNIIKEGAEDFFNGVRSAADAARIIQSRASIYVSEQS